MVNLNPENPSINPKTSNSTSQSVNNLPPTSENANVQAASQRALNSPSAEQPSPSVDLKQHALERLFPMLDQLGQMNIMVATKKGRSDLQRQWNGLPIHEKRRIIYEADEKGFKALFSFFMNSGLSMRELFLDPKTMGNTLALRSSRLNLEHFKLYFTHPSLNLEDQKYILRTLVSNGCHPRVIAECLKLIEVDSSYRELLIKDAQEHLKTPFERHGFVGEQKRREALETLRILNSDPRLKS